MSADLAATEADNGTAHSTQFGPSNAPHPTEHPTDEEEEEEEEEEDEEPKLKYTKLTGSLTSVYRNGDSTSSFLTAGDKLVVGTHSGCIHVFSLPALQPLRQYKAHNASVNAVSVSPVPPPPATIRQDSSSAILSASQAKAPASSSSSAANASPRNPRQQPQLPPTPSNSIYIATASIDGNVCVQSLVDPKDVLLRNFARPVQAVALSPDYRNDRMYLSGGKAGNLILTIGGKAGVSADANTNSAAAAASGWLGSIGLGSNTGKDTVLHSGEGSISTIKWSLSGRYVCWVNEQGIKIMRSELHLGEAGEDAWKRFAHVDKPHRKNWEDMAGVWKGRVEWISDKHLETDDSAEENGVTNGQDHDRIYTTPAKGSVSKKRVEKLVVGWGDTAWILHVTSGSGGVGAQKVGNADIVHKLQFRDCIVSGLSLYTPSLLAVLAYRTRDDDDKLIPSAVEDTPKRGRHHRQTGLPPQLRLIDIGSGEEVDLDELNMSRSETLSAADYHLGTMYMPAPQLMTQAQKGALESLGGGIWDAGASAARLFSSGATMVSRSSSGEKNGSLNVASPPSSAKGAAGVLDRRAIEADPHASSQGLKLFIQSPYDCVLAVKRDLSDHLKWLLEQHRYAAAWELIDQHPEIAGSSSDSRSFSSQPSTPSHTQGSLADFFADDSSETTASASRAFHSSSSKEKRRIGDLWLQQLVAASNWEAAGKVAGKVLGTSARWEHWVWTFAQADRFDDITPYIPSTQLKPPLPSLVYEVVLGHYILHDRPRLRSLLEEWDPELFDVSSVITAIEARLDSHDPDEDTVEDGERGRDWRILLEALAKLYLADSRPKEALKCYIRVQNADAAMMLIRDYNLLDAVADDVPGLLMLRVSRKQMKSAPLNELEEASSEAVQLLVDEAHNGTVPPDAVVRQLQRKGPSFKPLIFFYLRALWNGPATKDETTSHRLSQQKTAEGHAMVEDHPDLAVSLFAEYDRPLLMTFLRASDVYSYEKAGQTCEQRHFIPELVYVLSKTGQTKRALNLIIGELGDVSQAISFAKENPDLWDDLLDYSMDKPRFIRGLLEEVGTAINPITLVRRIPEGLEIEGLRDGIARMIKEYEIQHSISEGVAKVLRGEVAIGMDTLRAGQKKAVKFEVVHGGFDEVEVAAKDPPTKIDGELLPVARTQVPEKNIKQGHCAGCGDIFTENEKETLVGFACGHVYHLSCLLQANPETADSDAAETLQSQLASDDGYSTRSVGAKVAHAHIIKNAIRGGCQTCVIPEGA